MKRLGCVALGCLAAGALQGCVAMETDYPQRVAENKYVFVTIPKDSKLTAAIFKPASERAEEFCSRVAKTYVADVQREVVIEAGAEMDRFYFSCEERLS